MGDELLRLPDLSLMQEVDREEDPLRYYKTPLLNRFYFMRLRKAVRLLKNRRYPRLLDLGYGSGVMLPTLANYTDDLVAIDIHDKPNIVKDMAARENVRVTLIRADARELPFEDNAFDGIVSIAILDHISPVEKAAKEMARILKPGGSLLLGTVIENRLTNFFFACIRARTHVHHVSPYTRILPALEKHFIPEEAMQFPSFIPLKYSMYFWQRYRK